MDTLVFLAARPGQVVSAAELMAGVWTGRVVEEAAVYQTVAKLRRALGDDPHAPRFIETIPKKGYRLIATVSEAAADTASARPRLGRVVGAIAVLLLAGAGLYALNGTSGRLASQAETPMSIAVLPFVDMSADGSLAHLGDGIAEELIHRLSGRELRVIARTSSFALRGNTADVRSIGERLGVDTVLEGSVRRSADRLWVTAQLIDVDGGFHVWSQKYERPLGDVFSIQTDIADRVTRSVVSPRQDAGLPSPVYTPDALAYERYLLGRHQMQLRRVESLRRAIGYLREAVAIDPGFAAAQAALADALFLASDHRYGDLDDASAMTEAGQVADAALAIDPACVACLVATSRLHTLAGRLDEAEAAARRALQLRRADSEALAQLGEVLAARGDAGEAIAAFEKALERDPISARRQVRLAALNAFNDRPGPAERHYRLAVEIDPNWHVAWYGGAMFFRAYGRLPDALRWAHRAATIEAPGERFVAPAMRLVGEIWLELGERSKADEWLELAAGHAAVADRWWALNARVQALLALDRDDRARVLVREMSADRHATEAQLLWVPLYETMLESESARWAQNGEPGAGAAQTKRFVARGYLPALTRASVQDVRAVDTRHFKTLLETTPASAGRTYLQAVISHLEGDDNGAFELLHTAVAQGWLNAWYLRRDPALRGLRNDPRLDDVVHRITARQSALREELRSEPGYAVLAAVPGAAAKR